MKTKEIRQLLRDHFGDDPGTVTFSQGQWTVREGFFYTLGRSADNLEAAIREVFPHIQVEGKGEHWKAFKGGASLRAKSHFWVQFTVIKTDVARSEHSRLREANAKKIGRAHV